MFDTLPTEDELKESLALLTPQQLAEFEAEYKDCYTDKQRGEPMYEQPEPQLSKQSQQYEYSVFSHP